MLEEHLKRLIEELEFEPLPPLDETKTAHLAIHPGLTIALTELEVGMHLESPLTTLPEEKQEDLFIYLMRANFLGQGTGGSTISLNENKLRLSMTKNYDMSYRVFKESIEDFANYVEYWREELKKHVKEAREGIL